LYKISVIISAMALILPLAISSSYAETISISIKEGSSDPHQTPTFYPPASTALVGDTIEIGNGDSVSHTATSGTPNSGPDGKFDSGPIAPGKYYRYTIKSTDVGLIQFYDKAYPWMLASVTVQELNSAYKILHNVGADVGDGSKTFDVQYSSVKDIISSSVTAKDKSVNFVLVGKANSNSTLVLKLPKGLITGPFIGVWVDNQPITGYTTTDLSNGTIVNVPITALTEQVSVVGTSVVPEFGAVAVIVLAASILAIVAATRIIPTHRLG